jgi:hypothetical protein
MKFYKSFSLFLLGISFVIQGCSSNQAAAPPPPTLTAQEQQFVNNQQTISCPWPSNPNVAAPEWICSNYDSIDPSGKILYAVGAAKLKRQTMNRNAAAQRARAELASILKVQVDTMFKDYYNEIGVGDDSSVDAVVSSTIRNITSENLAGSEIERTVTGPDGTMYVLVSLSEESVKNAAKQAVRSSYKNDEKLYQEFKAKQSVEEMDAAIDKMNSRRQ